MKIELLRRSAKHREELEKEVELISERTQNVITNALIIDWSGIYKADIGIKNGRIAGIGKAGNPDVMAGVTPGMIFGVTTFIGGGTGPATGTCATTCTPGSKHLELMLQATDGLPMNFGFTGKGNTSLPEGLFDQIAAGAIGLKLQVRGFSRASAHRDGERGERGDHADQEDRDHQ